MPMTLEQLRNRLSAIEPDEGIYEGIGVSEIPILERLLQDKEPWMASRAVFALSRISHPKAVALLARTAADPRQEVRVALAASVNKLRPSDASSILQRLLADPDLGVRKFAVQAVSPAHNAAVHSKLRDLVAHDPAPSIREFAKAKLRELNRTEP
jgi:HEAT repeat protein